MRGWTRIVAAGVALLGAVAPGAADEKAPPAPVSSDSAADGFYVPPPPDTSAAGGRVGGGTRGVRPTACRATLSAVAPEDHGGLTLEAQPTLYFFLAQDTDCSVELVVNDRRQVPPLVEATVKSAQEAGLHAVKLADFGISLDPGVEYDWFVQLKSPTAGKESSAYSGAQVRRIAAPEGLAQELARPGAQRARVLAQHSLWYDAVAALSAEIDAAPGNRALRAQRAALLESVGLRDAAASERSAGTR